jgi:hypothetical protein
VIGYFLYKKFTTKFQKGAIKIPDIMPAMMKRAPPAVVETAPEPIPEPGVAEESS